MKNDGFTLVELAVVLVLIATLMSMGVPAYSSWKGRHGIESQTLLLSSDLELARMKAYTEKLPYRVRWGSSPFSSYVVGYDANNDGDFDDAGDRVLLRRNLDQPLTGGAATSATFNGRGFCTALTTVRPQAATTAGSDCVVISRTRIKVGKWDGSSCNPK